MRGLCGTLTWNQHDDFTTPEGDIENSVTSFVTKFILGSCFLPSPVMSDPCNTYTQRREYAESVCAVIHSPVFQVSRDLWFSSRIWGWCSWFPQIEHNYCWRCVCEDMCECLSRTCFCRKYWKSTYLFKCWVINQLAIANFSPSYWLSHPSLRAVMRWWSVSRTCASVWVRCVAARRTLSVSVLSSLPTLISVRRRGC